MTQLFIMVISTQTSTVIRLDDVIVDAEHPQGLVQVGLEKGAESPLGQDDVHWLRF